MVDSFDLRVVFSNNAQAFARLLRDGNMWCRPHQLNLGFIANDVLQSRSRASWSCRDADILDGCRRVRRCCSCLQTVAIASSFSRTFRIGIVESAYFNRPRPAVIR